MFKHVLYTKNANSVTEFFETFGFLFAILHTCEKLEEQKLEDACALCF